jgi:hypothetical protein
MAAAPHLPVVERAAGRPLKSQASRSTSAFAAALVSGSMPTISLPLLFSHKGRLRKSGKEGGGTGRAATLLWLPVLPRCGGMGCWPEQYITAGSRGISGRIYWWALHLPDFRLTSVLITRPIKLRSKLNIIRFII